MRTTTAVAGALALAMAASTGVQAHVLHRIADKDAFTLRTDVAKQVTRYTLCLVTAATKCEGKGALSSAECDLVTGAVAYERTPGRTTAKFQSAIAACDAKQDLDRRGTDYAGIGCPGDCDAAPGVQKCTDLAAYEAAIEAPGAVKAQIGLLAVLVDGGCASSGTPESEARIACVDDAITQLTKYASTIVKCEQKCELDSTGRKGGGAVTNAGVCLVGDVDAHPSTVQCEATAALKLTQPAAAALAPVVAALLSATIDVLFNTEDPTDPDSPAGTRSPCGVCGNGAREGSEACDGADVGICGECQADCTCAPPTHSANPVLP